MFSKKHLILGMAISVALAGCGGAEENSAQTSVSSQATKQKTISGKVNGLTTPETAMVTVSNSHELRSQRLASDGSFSLSDLDKNEKYTVKIHANGYKQNELPVVIPSLNSTDVNIDMSEEITPELDGKFHYVWEDDGQSVSGLEYASAVNSPLNIVINDEQQAVPNIAAAQTLYRDYKIVLDNSDLPWTQAHAYRLLETMRQLPQEHCRQGQVTTGSLPCEPSGLKEVKWILTSSHISEDITISENRDLVTISEDTFSYANPQIVTMDKQRGRFFSKRLHHAAVNYLTNAGKDRGAANFILENRFGVTIDTGSQDAPDATFASLYNTLPVTGAADRSASSWQPFTPKEILLIINQFEEMPSGLHIIRDKNTPEKGLKYLLRRRNGHDHLLYPDAPAVAWPSAGYIEFMEKAFNNANLEHMQRLVIHEKTHFIWHYVLNTELKLEWLKLSEWYRVDNTRAEDYLSQDPYSHDIHEKGSSHTHGSAYNPSITNITVDSSDGWSARKTTNFVSGYAQLKNPNEDLAESVSFFLNNPDKLRSRAPKKYEFIRDRLMSGVVYLQRIRKDLTFEVLNLYPDYVYPGKIKKVEVTVDGYADEEKEITIDLQLHTTDGSCDQDKNEQCLEGASSAYTRIFSQGDTYKDIHFYPVDGRGTPSDKLRATFTLPASAKDGWWSPAQIQITDPHGNQRYQRSTDYGWQLFINNPEEDTTAPQYLADSLRLTLGEKENIDGHTVQTMTAAWDVRENVGMSESGEACFARFANANSDVYSMNEFGTYHPTTDDRGYCQVDIKTTEYFRSGEYRVASLFMTDKSLNRSRMDFEDNNPVHPSSPKVTLTNINRDEDTQSPEIGLDGCSKVAAETPCIGIQAIPTSPAAPNGETAVELTYWARDDKSGLNKVSFKLRDPQGIEHNYFVDHNNSNTLFFVGNPQEWQEYHYNFVLPVGSAPGTWGIASMSFNDKAGNAKSEDFTETLIFTLK